MENSIFLGCNYNDQSIKSTFDNIKKRIELDHPIHCIVIDKRSSKTASDLWLDIKRLIDNSSFCIFDVTGFRPNVVLELGYALALKNNDKIMISFKSRKNKGKFPQWLLSDIGHLQRNQYNVVKDLEDSIRKHIENVEYMIRLKEFEKKCISSGDAKYYDYARRILFTIRNEGSKSEDQLKSIIIGSALRFTKLREFFKYYNLLSQDGNKRYIFP